LELLGLETGIMADSSNVKDWSC